MLKYPTFNPVAFHVGPFAVHWYGLMYLVGFGLIWLLAAFRIKQSLRANIAPPLQFAELEDFIFYLALGVIIGGRLGHVVFYGWQDFLADPWMPFKVWQGGMSFHGGLIGVGVAMFVFAKKHQKTFFSLSDFIVPLVPIGLALGRIGNFINGELWGRVTNVPWAMVFPMADLNPRHPSQIYELLVEGVLLFLLLWFYSRTPKPKMAVSALFLLGYGLGRFFCEFYREPDPPWGYILGHFSMGQLLSLPMILVGGWMLVKSYRVGWVKSSRGELGPNNQADPTK